MIKEAERVCKIYGSHYNGQGAANWIAGLDGFTFTKNIKDADLVVFGGGQDIDTRFYGEPVGKATGKPTTRDTVELADFMIAKEKGIKMVGICRGAQLLCALSGGKLIQHVTGHEYGQHYIKTIDDKTYTVNTIHHQMMFPFTLKKNDYKIIAWTPRQLSTTYLNGHNKENEMPLDFVEPEVVYFKNTNSLGIQFHPEMMYRGTSSGPTIHWLQKVFLQFYNNEL